MLKIEELEAQVTLFEQMQGSTAPVVLMNVFSVAPEETDLLLNAWQADAAIMARQQGFISTQLHKGIGGSSVFINYAEWRSVADFRAAFENPEFQDSLEKYPPSAMARPHLFEKINTPVTG